MGISHRLCEVRDRVFGGSQKTMADAWEMHESTLSRWLNRRRVPDPTWYDFLAAKLEEDISEIHRLCQIDRNEREPATAG